MRKIYLGFERSDFDARFMRLLPKSQGVFRGKLLGYYLLSLDWLSSEDCAFLRKEIQAKLAKIVDRNKKLFENEREAFLHQLDVHLLEYMESFLEDRHLIQLLHFKEHNFTNIIAFMKNCTCEFKGLVYLNLRVEREINLLRFLVDFDYKFGADLDVEVLVRFLLCVLQKEFAFLDELLRTFRKKYQAVENETLLMEFHDCYSEFRGCSRLLESVYADFGWYFAQKKVPRIQPMYVDPEADSEMEKTLFGLKNRLKPDLVQTRHTCNRYC